MWLILPQHMVVGHSSVNSVAINVLLKVVYSEVNQRWIYLNLLLPTSNSVGIAYQLCG